MAEIRRLDPESILRRIQEEEDGGKESGGILKIYLGFSAGVGKTYRMLQYAGNLRRAGIDVTVGVVETHGRSETEALIEGLEVLPRKKITYQGIELTELDIDGALARKPVLVLVDELAHTNAPGSRNLKRWQDVEELLKAGINVATTVNIQHIESMGDLVEKMTSVAVRETVPDSFFDLADEIELVDIPIEELERRLQEGKVYIPEKARQAMMEFFRKSNLMGLRELALRFTARQVSGEMLDYMRENAIQSPLPAGSRILVSVSSAATSKTLIRTANRLAGDLDAEWFAVHVDSAQYGEMSGEARKALDENLRLAEALGGKSVHLVGDRIADEIAGFAKKNGITLVLLGFSDRPRWQDFFFGNIGNEIIRKIKPVQVMFVDSGGGRKAESRKKAGSARIGLLRSIATFVLIGAVSALCYAFRINLGLDNTMMLMLLPVVGVAINWGLRQGLTASVLAVALLDFLFVKPQFTFSVDDIRYLPVFLSFFIVGLTVSLLSDRVRWRLEKYRQEERFQSTINRFSHELLRLSALPDIEDHTLSMLAGFFHCETAILLPGKEDIVKLDRKTEAVHDFGENERGIAQWVYHNGKPAGKYTDTLSSSPWYFLPLSSGESPIGVVALRKTEAGAEFGAEERRVLDSFANVAALAISRALSMTHSMHFLIDSL